MPQLSTAVIDALASDKTIDIITTGARTGARRVAEIWFTRVDDRIIICGTPSKDGSKGSRQGRDWLANLKATPRFVFCLKESVNAHLEARAGVITDPAERRYILCHPATQWYRDQGNTMEELLQGSPIVEVNFV